VNRTSGSRSYPLASKSICLPRPGGNKGGKRRREDLAFHRAAPVCENAFPAGERTAHDFAKGKERGTPAERTQ